MNPTDFTERQRFALAHPTIQDKKVVLPHDDCYQDIDRMQTCLEVRYADQLGWCWCASVARPRDTKRKAKMWTVGKWKPRWRKAAEAELDRLLEGVGDRTLATESLLPPGIKIENLSALHFWKTMRADEVVLVRKPESAA